MSGFDFSYDNVHCYGSELKLDQCAHTSPDPEITMGCRAAAVICNTEIPREGMGNNRVIDRDS